MICPRCGRLNEDGSNFCRFCSYDLSFDSSEQSLVPPEENPYTTEKMPVEGPKYKKYGIAALCSVLAAIVIVIILAVTLSPNGAEKAAKTYINAYMSGDFQQLSKVSSADTQKYYQTISQRSFGNLWGMFSPYSSYGDMTNQLSSNYAGMYGELVAEYGADFKTSLSHIKSQKLSDGEFYYLLTQYEQTYGEIFKDGEKTEAMRVSMAVKIDGTSKDDDIGYMNFYVIKIDSEWYVVTDGTLTLYGS